MAVTAWTFVSQRVWKQRSAGVVVVGSQLQTKRRVNIQPQPQPLIAMAITRFATENKALGPFFGLRTCTGIAKIPVEIEVAQLQ